jgi:hypothetical protein
MITTDNKLLLDKKWTNVWDQKLQFTYPYANIKDAQATASETLAKGLQLWKGKNFGRCF